MAGSLSFIWVPLTDFQLPVSSAGQMWARRAKCEVSRGTHFVTWAPSTDRWLASLYEGGTSGAMVFICMGGCMYYICVYIQMYGRDHPDERLRWFPQISRTLVRTSCTYARTLSPNKQTQSSFRSQLLADKKSEKSVSWSASLKDPSLKDASLNCLPLLWSFASSVAGPDIRSNSKRAQQELQIWVNLTHGRGHLYPNLKASTVPIENNEE